MLSIKKELACWKRGTEGVGSLASASASSGSSKLVIPIRTEHYFQNSLRIVTSPSSPSSYGGSTSSSAVASLSKKRKSESQEKEAGRETSMQMKTKEWRDDKTADTTEERKESDVVNKKSDQQKDQLVDNKQSPKPKPQPKPKPKPKPKVSFVTGKSVEFLGEKRK
jgi:hypothetical protein